MHRYKILLALITLFATVDLARAQDLIYNSLSRVELSDKSQSSLSGRGDAGNLSPRGDVTIRKYDLDSTYYRIEITVGTKTVHRQTLVEPDFRDRHTITFNTNDGSGVKVIVHPNQIVINNTQRDTYNSVITYNDNQFDNLALHLFEDGISLPPIQAGFHDTPCHLDLAVTHPTKGVTYTDAIGWNACRDKSSYEILGIVLISDGERFILDWEDRYNEVGGYTDWPTAIELYGTRIPTRAQAEVIKNCTSLREVATAYGSDNYGNYYWTRSECDWPDNDCAFIFCPGIPDAAYDRAEKEGPSNSGILLVQPF